MHIADGFLPAMVCAAGYATTAALTWVSLRQIGRQENPHEGVPRASLLAAAFFVITWIHIPVPPTTVHLVLNGLLGVIVGYYAMPALLVALFFQAVMFQHGGLTTLGVNATMMGLPALLVHYIFQLRHTFGWYGRVPTALLSMFAGAIAPALSLLFFFTVLITTIPTYVDAEVERAAIITLMLAHIPIILLEGIMTMLIVLFLQRVKPDLLMPVAPSQNPYPHPAPSHEPQH